MALKLEYVQSASVSYRELSKRGRETPGMLNMTLQSGKVACRVDSDRLVGVGGLRKQS